MWPRTPAAHRPLPSYARQTGLACSACHYQFLTLTPFGRKFKLNGYTLTNLASIIEKDSTNGGRLSLSPFSMLSAMVTAGVTHTKDDLPDTQNGAAALPQELSGFLAGRISSKIGMFSQFTYAGRRRRVRDRQRGHPVRRQDHGRQRPRSTYG